MIKIIQPLVSKFMPFAKKRMGFKKPPRIFLKKDQGNAQNPLGKTAYYDPENMSVTLYVTGRHPKDVMRSLSHELVHHTQNCNGEFDKPHSIGDGYAQNDEHLREMERQAYEIGNLCFRDWEDGIKNTTYYESLNKGARFTMSTKDWKNKELTQLLSEAWGFKFNSLQEFEEFDGTGEVQEEAEVQEDAEVQEEAQEDTEVQEEGQDEELEEGGAAARTGNEEKDQGRDRMHADRVHEGEDDGESLEEGFMDTLRGAGRKMGIGGASSSIVADAATYYEKGAEAMQAGDDRAAVGSFMALLNIGERIGAADLKKQARALRDADPKAQNPETVQQIAQLAKTEAQKAQDYVAGKKMEQSVSTKPTISETKIREILEKAIQLAKARKTTKE